MWADLHNRGDALLAACNRFTFNFAHTHPPLVMLRPANRAGQPLRRAGCGGCSRHTRRRRGRPAPRLPPPSPATRMSREAWEAGGRKAGLRRQTGRWQAGRRRAGRRERRRTGRRWAGRRAGTVTVTVRRRVRAGLLGLGVSAKQNHGRLRSWGVGGLLAWEEPSPRCVLRF